MFSTIFRLPSGLTPKYPVSAGCTTDAVLSISVSFFTSSSRAFFCASIMFGRLLYGSRGWM